MNTRTKFALRWTVTAVTVAWLAVAGANEYFELGVFRYESQKNQEALDLQLAECRGNFKQRYECKSQLLRAAGTSSFKYWSTRLGIVFGPPFALYVIYQIGMGFVVRQEQSASRARRLVRLEEKAEEERLAALEDARQRKIAMTRAKTFRDAKAAAQKARTDEPIQTLVVDQSDAGEKLCEELSELGYTAVASSDPDDALIGFKTLPYRLVVTDTAFKRKGMALKDAIAAMRKQKETLKVVAVSEEFPKMNPKDVQQSAVDLGADVGFPKPVEAAIFAEIARRLLEVKTPVTDAEPEPAAPAPAPEKQAAASKDEKPSVAEPLPDTDVVHETDAKTKK